MRCSKKRSRRLRWRSPKCKPQRKRFLVHGDAFLMIDNRLAKQGTRRRTFLTALILAALMVLLPFTAAGQTWHWSSQLIDAEGTDSAVRVDGNGNVHVSYRHTAGGQLKYGFLPAGGSRWFTMVVDQLLGDFLTGITVDENDNPFICYTPGTLKIARFDG